MTKRKTHQQYVNEVGKINPNVEVIGKYINNRTNILHRCKIDGYEWLSKPNNILNGKGCPLCAHLSSSRKKTKTHIQYVEEVVKINPNIEVLGKYVNNKTKILHKCKIDGWEWNAVPSSILCGSGCPKCASIKNAKRTTKSHEEYVAEVAIVNPDIEVVGKYINNATKILYRCKNGHEWEAVPTSILQGHGCSKCAGNTKKSHDEYVEQLRNIKPNIEALGVYVDAKTRILHKCKICGYEWIASPNSVLHNNIGCHYCSGKIKAHEQYVKELSEFNPHIDVIGEYVNANTKILHRCKIDGYEWYVTPNNVLHNRGCPKCSFSHGERIIETYLIKHNINYVPQHRFIDCRNKVPLPFDFYLPDYNVCIEFDGRQHYESIDCFGGEKYLQYVIQNDNIKTRYCMNNNITLLRIKYDDDAEEILDAFFTS